MRLTLAFLAALPILFAQDDPPSRVARLNYIDGSISMRPASLDDWVAAEINRPLTTGDNLWSDEASRAEMHIGSAALRLGSRTAFEFLNLDDRVVQIRLAQGTLSIRLRHLEEDQTFEVDTPNLSFTLLRPGDYRIDVNSDQNNTVAIVRSGDAEASGGGQSVTVHSRQQARAGGVDTTNYDLIEAPVRDNWDQWCAQRDQREEHSESARYVSPETVGAQDLDLYGTWSEQPDLGGVWFPRGVPVDWSPYHYGHWVWIEPWGWTWVDNAPWGFAPFHYGRWVFVAGGWGWVPGPKVVRPVYSPALVAWVGGPRLGASVSIGGRPGGVAWFPLGPGEVYVPAHRASRTYITRVNTNIDINVTNVRYVNRTAPRAVTAVSEDTLVRSRPVAGASVRLSGAQLEAGQITTHAPYSPQRESLAGSSNAGLRPSSAAISRQVVVRRAPPPVAVPFSNRQQALQADPGRPLPPDGLRTPDAGRDPRVRPATIPPAAQAPPVIAPSRRSDEYLRPPDRREAVRPAIETPVLVQPRPRPVEVAPRRAEESVPRPVDIVPPSRPVEIAPRRSEETPRIQHVEPAPRIQQVEPAPRRAEPPPVQAPQRIERPVERIERPQKQESPKREERRERPAPEKKEDKPKSDKS